MELKLTKTNEAANTLYLLMLANSRAYEHYESHVVERHLLQSPEEKVATAEIRYEALRARAAGLEFARLHMGA